MHSIRVFIGSHTPVLSDVEKNARSLAEKMGKARRAGCHLAVFPETALTGYCLGDRHRNPELLRDQEEALQKILLPASRGLSVVLGITHGLHQAKPYNGAAILSDGRLLGITAKTLLADEGVLEDSRHFIPGSPQDVKPYGIPLENGKTVRLGVLVCQDMWDDGAVFRPTARLADQGAQLLCVINASPFHLKKPALRLKTACDRVWETRLPLLYVNALSLEDVGKNLVLFDGHSFAVSKEGIRQNPPFVSGDVVWDIPLAAVEEPQEPQMAASPALLREALVFGLQEFFRKNPGFQHAVIGLSGGIDSAVDAALVARAIGTERLICVNMPTRFNSQVTRDLAFRIARNLKARHIVHPLDELIRVHEKSFASQLGQVKTLTMENIQARERGNLLMAYAQEFSAMVVGNGNKTEFQRGYATLYGDLIGALMPLGDVHKLLVHALGRELDPEGAILPSELYTLIPSAELSAEQNILEGKGDPFDYFLEAPMGVEWIENGTTLEDLCAAFREHRLDPELWIPDHEGRTVYEKMLEPEFAQYALEVKQAIERTFFKRVQSPPNIVVSPRAFGLDLRETLLGKQE